MLLWCSLRVAKCELGKGKLKKKKSTSDTRRFLWPTVERFHFVLPCVSARVSLCCCSAKYNRDHPLNVAFLPLGTVSSFLRLSTGRKFSDGLWEIIIQKANLYTRDMPKKTYLCMCNHINRSFCRKKNNVIYQTSPHGWWRNGASVPLRGSGRNPLVPRPPAPAADSLHYFSPGLGNNLLKMCIA